MRNTLQIPEPILRSLLLTAIAGDRDAWDELIQKTLEQLIEKASKQFYQLDTQIIYTTVFCYFENILRKKYTYRPESKQKVFSFLYVGCCRLLINEYNRLKKEQKRTTCFDEEVGANKRELANTVHEREVRWTNKEFFENLGKQCTIREKQVLEYLLQGYEPKEIAEEMKLGQSRISQIIKQIKKKGKNVSTQPHV